MGYRLLSIAFTRIRRMDIKANKDVFINRLKRTTKAPMVIFRHTRPLRVFSFMNIIRGVIFFFFRFLFQFAILFNFLLEKNVT